VSRFGLFGALFPPGTVPDRVTAYAWRYRLRSAANLREHWATKAKRVAEQRALGAMKVRQVTDAADRAGLLAAGLVVTLTRIAPRALDDDNLASAFKAIRDGVADALGIDDRDPRVSWRYAQERHGSDYGIAVQLATVEWTRRQDSGEADSEAESDLRARETGPEVVDYTGTGVQRQNNRRSKGEKVLAENRESRRVKP